MLFVTVAVSCGDDDDPPADAGLDASGSAPVCGNAKVEGDELCDKTDLNKETCATLADGMFSGGTLSCTSRCTFNTTKCTGGDDDSGTDMNDGGGGAGG